MVRREIKTGVNFLQLYNFLAADSDDERTSWHINFRPLDNDLMLAGTERLERGNNVSAVVLRLSKLGLQLLRVWTKDLDGEDAQSAFACVDGERGLLSHLAGLDTLAACLDLLRVTFMVANDLNKKKKGRGQKAEQRKAIKQQTVGKTNKQNFYSTFHPGDVARCSLTTCGRQVRLSEFRAGVGGGGGHEKLSFLLIFKTSAS